MDWTTACLDWAARLRAGGSIIPAPIFPDRAQEALAVFKQLRIVDALGSPTFGESCKPWVFDFVAAIFGAYDAETGRRLRQKGYDSIITAALRAALPSSPFHDEGIAFGSWMDQVYATCYQLLGKVKAGEIEEPNAAELIAMLLPGLVFED